ncbi:MAG: hypothetical protein QW791_06835 [Candidatus Bathyarchaeia archaeon]
MEGKVSIFWPGKLISVGTKSIEKAFQELQQTAKALNANLKTEPKVQNIIAIADLKTSIDMEHVVSKLRKDKETHVIYEPEQFPAAIIKLPINQTAKQQYSYSAAENSSAQGLRTPNKLKKR